MISTLTGRVTHLGLDHLVLEVHGVGYAVRTTPRRCWRPVTATS
ncbi:OB-fold domain-containing protein [Brachybacterium sillae]